MSVKDRTAKKSAIEKIARSRKAITYALLTGIIVLAVVIRLLPMRWGVYLDEFDPYIHYKGAMYILENGFSAWFSWFDPTRWAPWGTDVPSSAQLGPPFTGALFYLLLKQIGLNLTLQEALAVFPVISGAVLTLLIFVLGRELVNDFVGLFSAFVFAIDPTSIQRTGLGFFDTEATGLLGMFVSLIFFVKALKKRTIPYAIISGLALGYMVTCWGAYLYPFNFLALYTILLVILGRWNARLSVAIAVVSSITMLSMALTPNIGVYGALSPYSAAPIIAFITCLVMMATSSVQDRNLRRKLAIGGVFSIIGIAAVAVFSGALGPIGGKFLLFVNPFARLAAPVVGTVGEQFPSTWSVFFYNYHMLALLAPAGAYFALKRMKSEDLFVLLFALMAIYGAAIYIRLLIIVAPAIAMLAGLAMDNVIQKFAVKKEAVKGKKSHPRQLGKIYGVVILAIVAAGFVPAVYSSIRASNRPVMLVSGCTGIAASVSDWMDALEWMRANIPPGSVVGCWWDYGYWINVIANKSVIADNSTINGTQIELIARAFLNDEEHGLEIFKTMKVEYVVVFEPWIIALNNPLLGLPPWSVIGDFEKSTAMMVIAGYNSSDYIGHLPLNIGGRMVNYPLPTGPRASTALLYKLLFHPFREGYSSVLGIDIQPLKNFELVYHSNNYWVLIYKVNY